MEGVTPEQTSKFEDNSGDCLLCRPSKSHHMCVNTDWLSMYVRAEVYFWYKVPLHHGMAQRLGGNVEGALSPSHGTHAQGVLEVNARGEPIRKRLSSTAPRQRLRRSIAWAPVRSLRDRASSVSSVLVSTLRVRVRQINQQFFLGPN
jgi:hypothetical protein